ncbi:MAG: hypothetical protein A2086_01720 [Spirochaetes bacterium GWD1_27_9]|nr:MAG: hypothetical protein A2Z98_04010 [Spirochaetes bacterium GWB1_27_13]OHD20612.1 MAG: hypothetical protein A2Y34_17490 [Spirochaetes bacterium GWC1_27_15]OHD41821.1 MAG: hypothetical protein A2086_01720 [Spirochaetes bacterium GWD1_27_9]
MNTIIKLTDEKYHSSEGLSNSFLIRFDQSPAHSFTKFTETEGMKTGTLFHKFILEPQVFEKDYVIAPDTVSKDKRTASYKEYAKTQDKEILFQDDIANLKKVKKNIYDYLFEGIKLENYINESHKELSLFWILFIKKQEVQCKAKLDLIYIKNDMAIIFDLKKVQNCLEFSKSVINYKYYRQAAFYKTALEILHPELKSVRFIFITVEEQTPFGVLTYELDDEFLFTGEKESYQSIVNYLSWDGNKEKIYDNKVVVLQKPEWLKSA